MQASPAGLFLLVLALAVFLAGQHFSPSVTADDLNNLLLDANFIPGDPVSLYGSIEWALAETDFEDRWSVNAPYGESPLSVLLIDSSEPGIAEHRHIDILRKNAVFLRRLRSVVVDYQLIETIGTKYFAHDLDMGVSATLLNWIVGHEIGHLVRGHRTSHFQLNDMLRRKWRSSASQRRENEADDYFAEIIRKSEQHVADTYVSVFARIIEYEAATATGHAMTSDRRPHSHPAYLIRAFRFLERLVDADQDRELADLVEGWGRRLGL